MLRKTADSMVFLAGDRGREKNTAAVPAAVYTSCRASSKLQGSGGLGLLLFLVCAYTSIYISTYLACSVYRGLVGNERSLDDYNNPTSSQGGISFQGVRSCWSLYRVWLSTSTLFSRRLFIRIYTPRKLPKARDCIT